MDKRDFLRTIGGAMSAAILGDSVTASSQPSGSLPGSLPGPPTEPPDFWVQLRKRYALPKDRIDLEHGYYSRMSNDVLEAFVGHVRSINTDAAFYMRTRQADDKNAARTALAELAGCATDELIITRNTTESLDTIIAGQPWQAGDQAVMAQQDYGAMLLMFEQVGRRHGVENRAVSLPMDPKSDEEIVELYASAITKKTRLLMVSHIVNITGHVMPVKKIVEMAHSKNVLVMVDGAHAFAHLDFKIPDLGCDYYGASLHKWLGCPLGAGILYVRKQRVKELWPMYGDHHAEDSIDKLNHTGTHPVHTDLAILDAIRLHREIGAERKEKRLRWLQKYWTDQARKLPKVLLNTPTDPARTCAIANVGIEGLRPHELAKKLLDEHRIFTVAINAAGVHGVRVTPHLYTTTEELDAFVQALRDCTP
tara:strand:+ start:1499 stop:2764 length:1266 start_codon:yes stop_codon:yes gene_type:complete